MKRLSQWVVIICFITLGSAALAAKDPNKNAIKARQGEMQLRSFNTGPLFAMAKGDIPYDAAMANQLTANLQKLLEIDMSRSWPEGSDLDNYFGETTSKPEIWSTYPDIFEYRKRYADAVNDLAAVAGNGQDALRSKIGALGKTCKGCHDDFREKQ